MRTWIATAGLLLLTSCVSTTGIVPDGPDAYRIASDGSTGATKSTKLQAKNYEAASAFCAERGKVVETIEADSKRAAPLGGYPEANLRFRCVTRTE